MATPIPTTLPPGVRSIRLSPQIPPYMPAGTEWWIVEDYRGGQQGVTPAQYYQQVQNGYYGVPTGHPSSYENMAPDFQPGAGVGVAPRTPQTDAEWQWIQNVMAISSEQAHGLFGGTTAGGETLPPVTTAAGKAAQMLYSAMRGLPFISTDFLASLRSGQPPAPRTVTPQTLAALSADSTLSDAFFSVIKANALYPASYLAEIGRYIPRGREATPSFI